LVFETDDAARGIQAETFVEEVSDSAGQTQLVAGIAAMTTGRTLRIDQPRLIQAPQEPGCHAEDLCRAAHRVGRVVLVVDPLGRCLRV
jgi:hypothetical protein